MWSVFDEWDNDLYVAQVIAVLNRENEVSTDVDSDDEEDDEEIDPDKLTLDRLKLALKYEQKQVRAIKLLIPKEKWLELISLHGQWVEFMWKGLQKLTLKYCRVPGKWGLQ